MAHQTQGQAKVEEDLQSQQAPPSVTAHPPTVQDGEEPTTAAAPTTTTTNTSSSAPAPPTHPRAYLPLPAPSDATTQKDDDEQNRTTIVEVNGQAISLDHLGPTVISRDGALSRIANWGEMTERERANTLRVLGKRNQLRIATLRNGGSGDGNNNSAGTEGTGNASG